jgi:hypothetical protein
VPSKGIGEDLAPLMRALESSPVMCHGVWYSKRTPTHRTSPFKIIISGPCAVNAKPPRRDSPSWIDRLDATMRPFRQATATTGCP